MSENMTTGDAWASQLGEWQSEAQEVKAGVLEIGTIESAEAYQQAGALLDFVKGRLKVVDKVRKDAKEPSAREVKRIDTAFQATIRALEEAETRLKNLVGGWIMRQREEQQRLLMEAQAAAQAQRTTDPDRTDLKAAAALVEAARLAAPARIDGISGRNVWRIEVTDPDLVPRDFCSPDVAKLKKAVDGGARTIPGVRITAEVQVIARAS